MSTSTQIYLIVEVDADRTAAAAANLAAVLNESTIASVLFQSRDGEGLSADDLKPLIAQAQSKGVAAFVADAGLAVGIGADGLHLPWSKEQAAHYAAARQQLGAPIMIGADAGRSRHDAMALGEAGADYVAFGIPPHVENRAQAAERRLDLIAWWSELFEIPCVAFDVEDAEQAGRLAVAGADFVTLRIGADTLPAEAARLAHAYASALAGESVA